MRPHSARSARRGFANHVGAVRRHETEQRIAERGATLEALLGPQLPTGYAGCLMLAAIPPLWFRVMDPRLNDLHPSLTPETR